MNLLALATAPVRIGLAAAEAGLGVAGGALDVAKRALGEDGTPTAGMPNIFAINDTVARANRIAAMMDDNAPLGRALAPDGPIDRLLRPGGLVDRLTAPGGVLDRVTA